MDYEASMHDVLERLVYDESAEPRELPLSLLRAITNDFIGAQEIGRGVFATVYKGVLGNGTAVAVKKMYFRMEDGDQGFINELRCLMGLKHKNIVRLLGYCAESQSEMAEMCGRLLCFEYMRGGSLAAYITDASHGPGWRKRYKILKGISEGLYYLHRNLTVHLDLQPDNIRLDEKKLPKILGFGGSRRLEEKEGRDIVENPTGRRGYVAPEFIENGVITLKADIYSLGVLITEILTGHKEHSGVDNILENWGERFGTSLEDTRLEQIRVCAEIAKSCLDNDPKKRPDVEHIIDMLLETESTYEFTDLDETENVDGFTESDEVSLSRVMQVTKSHLPEFGHITLITIVNAHGSKLKLHTILFDLCLSKSVYDGLLNMHPGSYIKNLCAIASRRSHERKLFTKFISYLKATIFMK